jgi:hypothetical protein
VVRVAKAILAAGAVALVTWVAGPGRFVMRFAYLSLASAYLHRPLRYEIDEGFRGWARVTFGQPNCRSLENDGFSLVIHINEKGQSCTSDRSPLSAWRRTSYFYIARDGTKRELFLWDMVWLKECINQTLSTRTKRRIFSLALPRNFGKRDHRNPDSGILLASRDNGRVRS